MVSKTSLGACVVMGAVAALTARSLATEVVLFQDTYEATTGVLPVIPNAPQVGFYPTVTPLIPEGHVVAAGGTEPPSPDTGTNILKTYGKQRTYGQFTSSTGTAGTLRLDMDLRLDGNTAYAFGLCGDAGASSLDGLKASIWIQINSTTTVQAYNGTWQTLTGLSNTVGQWQHYTLEYVIGSNQFSLTAGANQVTSTHLDGVTSVANFTHAFVLGGTTSCLGYADNFKAAIEVPTPTEAGWNVNADGNWSETGNWTGGVPNGIGHVANFGTIATAAHTVTVDGTPTVGALNFSSPNAYSLAGSNPITLNAWSDQAQINVTDGSHSIATPVVLAKNTTITTAASTGVALTGAVTATGKTITKAGTGSVQFENVRATGLSVNEGQVKISAKTLANDPTGTSVVKNLSVVAGASLDLANNSAVLDYTTLGTLQDDTRLMLGDGRLKTTSAGALGYVDNAVAGLTTFAGQTVDTTSLLVKFTYGGDANLDGQVDISDLGALATAWQTAALWTGGDFNYDAFVDISDLGILATNWQLGVGAPLGPSFDEALASVGLAGVSVPEPSVLALSSLGLIGLVARRRSRTV